MYLEEIEITGFKLFNNSFTAKFDEGLTVIVGENGTGKSAIIDAIRLLLNEDEFGRFGITSSDFYREIKAPSSSIGIDKINIAAIFNELSDAEQVACLPWLDLNDTKKARLNLSVENKEDNYGRYKRRIWGNETVSGIFEWELLNAINCIYLPPLRNALDKLQALRGSRLSRLIKNLSPKLGKGEKHQLEKDFIEFNKILLKDGTIKKADKSIKNNLKDILGTIFGQDAMIQFSEVNFSKIVERLKLLFYPILSNQNKGTDVELFRELNENSLGYNNIFYLATVLSELEGLSNNETLHKILLIEEPEAHLHPQLQTKLLQYLQEKSNDNKIQIIVTTHSPTLAASVKLTNLKVLSLNKIGENPIFTSLSKCGLTENNKFFLQRWLDITKSILLFAKGVLLVEGIAEALIIPELAKKYILDMANEFEQEPKPKTLEDFGISIISLGGIFFDHFMQIFKGYKINEDGTVNKAIEKINIRCSGLTDNDPENESKPTKKDTVTGTNRMLYLINELKQNSENTRLFSNLKTFEYDLSMEGNNLSQMCKIFLCFVNTDGNIKKTTEEYIQESWNDKADIEKAEASFWFLNQLEQGNFVKKGLFAQKLAIEICEGDIEIQIPEYIKEAFNWLLKPHLKNE